MDINRPDFDEYIERLLRIETPDHSVVNDIRHAYHILIGAGFTDPGSAGGDSERNPLQEHLGALGFFLFCTAATDSDRSEALFDLDPNEYLEKPWTRAYLTRRYDVQEPLYINGTLTLLTVGTSSFILKLKGHKRVLKIIKPYFFDFPRITDATNKYRTKYGDLGEISPEIFDSRPLFVDMEYVQGDTLSIFMTRYLHADSLDLQGRFDQAQLIVQSICNSLRHCASLRLPVRHLDLSPDNIIVQHEDGRVKDIKLIDFGFNYLLSERIGGASRLARAQSYIARICLPREVAA